MDSTQITKTAVVTGASRGIGLAISKALAAAGFHVVAGARHNTDELRALEAAGSATFVEADVSVPEGPQALIGAAAHRGSIDILVNNAGSANPRFEGILSVNDEQWAESIALNFLSAVRTTLAALPHMLQRGARSS